MAAPDKTGYLVVKMKPGKIKIALSEGSEPFSLKFKENKVKVKRGDEVFGKVKFYPDTGKLKVKDKDNKPVARIKNAGKLRAAPGVFLIKDLDRDRRDFLLALLFGLGK